MIFVIISDVHANLEAVYACFKRIDEIRPDKIICLGDLVDYCAQPNEVADIIKSRSDIVVLGNHDEAQFNFKIADGFSENAYISSLHTRKVIQKEHAEYFRTLPFAYSLENLFFVHASPAEPNEYDYVLNVEAAGYNFNHFSEKICFIGHSHIPIIFEENKNKVKVIKDGRLNKDKRYIINVGSVGQPRDNDPRLCFGVFDTGKFQFRLERLGYDIKSASEKIIREGLPLHLAQRLLKGV
jgi:predicted phosphodiesterase